MSTKGLFDRFRDFLLGDPWAQNPAQVPHSVTPSQPETPAEPEGPAEAVEDPAAPPGRPSFDQWMDDIATSDTAMEAASSALDPDAWGNMPGCTDEELMRRRKTARRIAKLVIDSYQKVLDESEAARNRDNARRAVRDALDDPDNPLTVPWR